MPKARIALVAAAAAALAVAIVVPGLASAVCRALGERARRAEDGAYRSPLASRSG